MKRFTKAKLGKIVVVLTIALLGVSVIVALAQIDYGCDWTGFGQCVTLKQNNEEIRPGKTLWDWMNLLIVPVVLAVGGILYNRAERQKEQRRIDDSLQEAVLSAYLDRISNLLLNNNLRGEKANMAARDVALGWTTMALPRLNGERKGVVLQFLHGANLLNKDDPVLPLGDVDLSGISLHAWLEDIYLNGANMAKANLEGCYFWGADLSAADLEGANLENANLGEVNLENAWLVEVNLKTFSISGNLKGARLKNADLTGTDLSGVDLSGADLQGAKITGEQLAQALSFKGAVMPNGSRHE